MRGIFRQFSVLLSTVFVITINALANILPINGQLTGEISDSFDVYFVPAGYVFSIWGLIYVLLIIFTIYQALPQNRENQFLDTIGFWYVVSAIANSIWIVLWHYNYPVFSVIAMLVLLISLCFMYVNLMYERTDMKTVSKFTIGLPISVYLGWITVATVANVTVALYVLEWGGWGIDGTVWASILIVVAALLGVVFLTSFQDVAYALVIVWALVGIGIKFQEIAVMNYSVMGTVAILIVFSIFYIGKRLFSIRKTSNNN